MIVPEYRRLGESLLHLIPAICIVVKVLFLPASLWQQGRVVFVMQGNMKILGGRMDAET